MATYTIDPDLARRLAIDGALLAGPRPPATADAIVDVAVRLGGLQIDPTRTIERTEQLVVWSRLGSYDRTILERLIYPERKLFETSAFYIPIERLAEIRFQQKLFASGVGGWGKEAKKWVDANARAHRSILDRLRADGALPSRAIDAKAFDAPWKSSGWTNDRNMTRMLEFMDARGEISVSRRQGNERLWDLPERVLPATEDLTAPEYLRRRSLRLVRRFGLGTVSEIRDRNPAVPDVDRAALTKVLNELTEDGQLVALDDKTWRHSDANVNAQPQLTTLLSPFEPLIKDRERVERWWGFKYKLEMYVPKEKREFGHYVLPVLHHDRLVGRLAAEMDRKENILRIEGLHWEAQPAAAEAKAVDKVIADLAGWLGAREVTRPA